MAGFQEWQARLAEAGVSIYALSTDTFERAQETVTEQGLTFPVLYGADGPDLSGRWGAFYEARRGILNAASFILRPEDHAIAHASWSTGPVSRLTGEDAHRIITFWQQQAS